MSGLAPLSSAYVDHLTSPRRRGDLEPADAVGEAGTPLVGTGVRLTLRLRRRWLRAPRIADARFRVVGSATAIAPASWTVERVVGMTVTEARAVDAAAILAGLGPVPSRVADAARLVASALADALAAKPGPHAEDPGLLVCRCFLVGDVRIRRAIRAGACTVPEISDASTAGRGCHSCWPDLRALVDDERAPAPPPLPEGDAVLRIADAVVRPLWRAQGVHLGRVAVDGTVVRLEVERVDADAMLLPVGAVATAARALREVLGDAVRVEALGVSAAPSGAPSRPP